MAYFIAALIVAAFVVGCILSYKYGQNTVLKAFEKFHLLTALGDNLRADFANFFIKVKKDFHL